MDMNIFTFNPSSVETCIVKTIEELSFCKNKGIMWININDLSDIEAIKKLEGLYDIHPLTIEDVLSTRQQPKVETFPNYRYFSFKTIKLGNTINEKSKKKKADSEDDIFINQISMIIMKDILITFQEIPKQAQPIDAFNKIRKQLLDNLGTIRTRGTDYLAYSIIDIEVDEYYLALAHLEEHIEDFEERAIITSDDNFISEIQDTKKYIYQIKRVMLPLRENLVNISHQALPFSSDDLKPFLQDLHENLNNAIDIVDSYREWLSNIMDVNLSVLSYQMNKVMKILATVSAIFIPLTFIAGVYGMNFQFMPELSKPWAYPIVLGGMAVVAVGMVVFFKIRKWF
jgi:magnesium transporter